MLKFNTKQHRPPMGGHQFPSHGMIFRGDTIEDVIKKIKDFRLNNNIAAGDPEQEVLRHYAQHWPWTVRRSIEVEAGVESDEYVAWRTWLHETWRKPVSKCVVPKEASERWLKCTNCPMNQKISGQNHHEENELRKRAFVLRKGVDVPSWLGYCSHHRWDTPVASFIEDAKQHSNAKSGTTAPAGCWV